MEVFTHTATQMAILFLLMGAGFLAHKIKLMNDSFDTMLSKLIMNIAMPALIVGSVLNSSNLPDVKTILLILLVSSLALVIMVAIADVLSRLYRKSTVNERGAHAFAMCFGNVGFMGFPVLSAIFGSDAVLYAAIFNIPFNFAVFTYGIAALGRGSEKTSSGDRQNESRAKRIVKNLVNPCNVSCVIAPVLAAFNITDEGGIIGTFCETLGQFVVPGSMLVIGSNLAKMSFKDMVSHGNVYVTTAMKLLVLPMVVFLVFRNFISDSMLLGVLVIGSAMPTASLGTMLSLIYGGNIKTIMRCTFVSTLLSLLTIPLVATIVMM